MLNLHHVSYTHPNKDLLFSDINLTIGAHEKVALTGTNGIGKSTLLKIIAGALKPSDGHLDLAFKDKPYYIPQMFGQYNHLTVAQALGIDKKLNAFNEILNGNASAQNFELLGEDWTIEERCKDALLHWKLDDLDLNQTMSTLSGGEKTKALLAGIAMHQPDLVLMDEPSNHLDMAGRQLLYAFIKDTKCAVAVVSHDRKLLNLLSTIYELNNHGIKMYSGNYDSYLAQKQIEQNALSHNIHSKERELRKAREKERETMERMQKLDTRGKGKQEKAGVAKIMMNTLRNKAENSTSKIKSAHAEKIGDISKELNDLRINHTDIGKMKVGFDNSGLHKGKKLFLAENINFSYAIPLWKKDLNLEIISGERIALKGGNGSGKTTLTRIVTGAVEPTRGTVKRSINNSVYVDQEYSLINNKLTVYEQAENYNSSGLEQHDIKMRLNRFLFRQADWNKACGVLSGGERMRLMLCCLTIGNQAPDIIILDEPTNNLDIQNIEILTAAINEYRGTLLIISHDETFLDEINIERTILIE